MRAPAFWVTSSSIGRSKSSAPKSSARKASSLSVSTEVRMCRTLSRKMRESGDVAPVLARRDLPAAERRAVRLVRPAEEREEPVEAVAQALVLEVARPLQVLEPLLERLVEADHHRRRRPHPALDDRALRLEVLGHRVLPLRMPLAEVLGEDLAPAARDPVHARVAEARRRLGVGEPGAVGEEDELRHRQRVELDAVAVALAHRREEVAVEVERQLRVEAAVERDEVTADLEQLVDLREHLLPVEHVAAVLVRQDVERAVVALGDADVRVVDDAHHHVGRAIRLVPAGARLAGEVAELVVRRLVPEACGLVDRDPTHVGTASSTVTSSGSSVSMNELTEKTAFPAPATP